VPELFLKALTGKVKPRPFATLDIETIPTLEKCYLVGFYDGVSYKHFDTVGDLDGWVCADKFTPGGYVQVEGKKVGSIPYLPDDLEGPISRYLTWLFSTDKYCKYWIYAHNGGSFDFLYLVRWLLEHGTEFSFDVIPLQSSILRLEVRRKSQSKKKPHTWTFLDSYRLMNTGLEKLGKVLVGEGKTVKLHSDGTEVDEKVQAEVERYYAELHFNPQRYEYLKQDTSLLYRCLEAFNLLVSRGGGEVGMTAPSSAMKSFRRMHLKDWIPINRCFPGCNCGK
jgi:hypothetical protein